MQTLLISFIAGILTILAPCTFTLLPIILGASARAKTIRRTALILISLAVSIVVFTLVLEFLTSLLGVPATWWRNISGIILTLFGLFLIFPELWNFISAKVNLSSSGKVLDMVNADEGILSDILVGFSLGPVLSSCSPTFLVVVATVLPKSFFEGVLNLVAYAIGLALVLFPVAVFGHEFTIKMKWSVNPKGNFKRILGFVFFTLGLLIVFGVDKDFEAFLISNNLYFNLTDFEVDLLDKI